MAKLLKPYEFDWHRIFAIDGYHIEYSITDVCNRNCASCSHLAPIAKSPNFVSVEEFTRVVKTMRQIIPRVHTFWLTGGEPTLHPHYIELLRIVREIYDDCYIGIYSNGITLRNYEDELMFWQFIREAGIVWAITNYDIPCAYFAELFESRDCTNNLVIIQSGKIFAKLTNYSYGQAASHDKYIKCGWERSKLNIRNGRIFNCPSSEFADLFNEYFDENLKITENDYLTVDDKLTLHRINEFREAIPFCTQCDLSKRKTEIFANSSSRKEKSEWSDL